jgi:hypothetical protein
MSYFRGFLAVTYALIWASTTFFATSASAQDAPSSKSDQWIHVRVESKEDHGETVRVNVPIEMAAKVLPAIHDGQLRDGKVRIDGDKMNKDVDLRAILEAVTSSRDGEYVTVQGQEQDVRVAKNNGYLYVHVTDKSDGNKATAKGTKAPGTPRGTRVEVKVPMKVVDALLSAGKDELDIVAALKVLSAHGDTDLVTVKDEENTVRIWVDSKNVSD